VSLGFFSLVTFGVLPLVFISMAHQRRRRLRRFFREGSPARGVIFRIELESVGFEQKLARVSYEFEADGETHRDSDQVLPAIANRWHAGDAIEILYLPEYEYDSVIISTS
jgi:hypothetical protein